jgi:hypothetical protein
MKTRELNAALAAANPVQSGSLDGLDFAAMEADLLADLATDRPSLDGLDPTGTRRPLRRYAVALGAAAVAAVVSVIVLLAGSGADQPSRAYGAELVRFAESSPLLLLEGPGWRVEDVYEQEGGEGSMEFVTGKPIPDESTTISADGTVSGMARKADRQRKVDLSWRRGKLEFPGAEFPGAPVIRPAKAPVLDTTALVDTRAERLYTRTTAGKTHVILLGGPGDRQMVAIWKEGGLLLEMRAWVSNLAAFEERLGWLNRVDSQTWLDAMPAKVVKAADHDATVREMLKGIPLPGDFKPSLIPDAGLTTNRSQVAGAVTNTVSCLWFRQWGEARRTGDRAKKLEAERAMATARHWPIVRQIEKEGGYPETLLKLVASMPSGIWQFGPHRWRLLPKAEGLGCARLGLPLLPRKRKRRSTW